MFLEMNLMRFGLDIETCTKEKLVPGVNLENR